MEFLFRVHNRFLFRVVLILLLMEYGHGEVGFVSYHQLVDSLNPSFNGIWSWSDNKKPLKLETKKVLILLLMEYGHGVPKLPSAVL